MISKKHILTFCFLFIAIQGYSQTWTELEKEYNSALDQNKLDDALFKAKELYFLALKNETDTSINIPVSLKYIGHSYSYLAKYDSSQFYYFLALEKFISQKKSNKTEQGKIYYYLGRNYIDKKEFELSIKHLDSAKNIILNYKEKNIYALCLIYRELGNSYFSLKKIDEAIKYTKKAHYLTENYKFKYTFKSDIKFRLGMLYFSLNDFETSKYYFSSALNLTKISAGEKSIDYAEVANNLGSVFIQTGELDSANFYLLQANEIFEKNTKSTEQNYILNIINLSTLTLMNQNLKKTNYYLQKLKPPNISDENYLLYDMYFENYGYYYYLSGEIENSLLNYNKSKEIKKHLYGVESLEYIRILSHLFNIYFIKNENKLAEETINYCIKKTESNFEIKNRNYCRLLTAYSVFKRSYGDFNSSIHYAQKSIEIQNKFLNEFDVDFTQNYESIAATYMVKNDFINAELYFQKSFEIYKQNNSNNLSYSYLLLRYAYFKLEQENYADAIDNFDKVISLNKKFNSANLNNMSLFGLGVCNLDLKKNKTALNYFNKIDTLNIFDPTVYSYFNIIKSIALFQEKQYIKSESNLYQTYLNVVNSTNENLSWLIESQTKQYWDLQLKIIDILFFQCIELSNYLPNSKNLAYNVSMFRTSLLLENSRRFIDAARQENDSNIIMTFNDLKSKRQYLSKLESEGSTNYTLINKLNTEADSLDKILVNKFGAYAEMKKKLQINYNDVKNNLSNDEAAIEFTRYYDYNDTAYYYSALIAHKNFEYPQLVKLCSEKELKSLSPEKELNEIYKLVWQPIEQYLTGIKTIYYSSSGLLNNIPFHALYDNKKSTRNYVMDNYTLHQLTSTRYLALGLKQKDNTIKETSIALFGGVNYNEFTTNSTLANDTLKQIAEEASFLYKNAIATRDIDETRYGISYLPATKQEVENIETLLKTKNWQVDVSKGIEASENKLKSYSGANSKSILHIATHGFAFAEKEEAKDKTRIMFDLGNTKFKVADNPMIRSGLLFSGANQTWTGQEDSLRINNGEDGILTAYELSQLELDKTELVVLSACETGKGAIHSTEGTFGLKRALKLAGVENMIVSLWKVPDAATMEMMTLFYEQLAESKNPLTSFETTQKTMRIKYPDEPSKWAGFVFVR